MNQPISESICETESFKTVRFMFEAATKLHMSSIALATAVTLFHRFCREIESDSFDQKTIATAMLYLSSNVEEESLRLRDVINVCHRVANPHEEPLDVDSRYWSLKESLIQTELFIMRVLSFRVKVDHPHKYLMHFLKSLYDWLDKSVTAKFPIAHWCWALLNDSYHSSALCIDYKPQLLAVSIIYVVLSIYKIHVPYNGEARIKWWEALVESATMKSIEEVGMKLMDLYEQEVELLKKTKL